MSATSLKLLLRDPIRFAWRYALGWKQPDAVEEPLTLDALTFGGLVHGVLEQAVNILEANGGFGHADATRIEQAIAEATAAIADAWEREQPVPPPVIWRSALERAKGLALVALTYPLEPLPKQKSWTEVPFGTLEAAARNDLPLDPARKVEIPGAGVFIQGHIDRLDLSGDGSRARVIDYKTGKPRAKMAEVVIDGGGELQRCLYAFAVKTLARPEDQNRGGAALSTGGGGRAGVVSAARRRRHARAVGRRDRSRETQHRGRARVAGDRRQ